MCASCIIPTLYASPLTTVARCITFTLAGSYIGAGAGGIIVASIGATKGIYAGMKRAHSSWIHQNLYETAGDIIEPTTRGLIKGCVDGAFYGTCIGAATGFMWSVARCR
jgi:hypothetical protein